MAKIDLYAQNWCDLVFKERNKEYGAYKMRAETGKRNTWAFIIVLIICALAIIVPALVKMVAGKGNTDIEQVTQFSTLQKKEAKVQDQHIEKKVEPKKEVQQIKSSIKFTAPVIAKDNEVTEADEMKSQTELGETKVEIGSATVVGNNEHGQNIDEIKGPIITHQEEDNKVYDIVEQMPQFRGGDDALLEYVNKHLNYPSISLEQGVEGIVKLRFVVLPDGSVGDVQVVKSLDSHCDREAVRVVKSLPKFVPGKQGGRSVAVWFSMPVRFAIEN